MNQALNIRSNYFSSVQFVPVLLGMVVEKTVSRPPWVLFDGSSLLSFQSLRPIFLGILTVCRWVCVGGSWIRHLCWWIRPIFLSRVPRVVTISRSVGCLLRETSSFSLLGLRVCRWRDFAGNRRSRLSGFSSFLRRSGILIRMWVRLFQRSCAWVFVWVTSKSLRSIRGKVVRVVFLQCRSWGGIYVVRAYAGDSKETLIHRRGRLRERVVVSSGRL